MKNLIAVLLTALLPLLAGAAEHEQSPSAFWLGQNYPNPFNPTTTIPYTLSQTTTVRLIVYDLLGKQVRLLVDEEQPAGNYQVIWNGLDDSQRAASAGIYFCKMSAAHDEVMRRMVLIR